LKLYEDKKYSLEENDLIQLIEVMKAIIEVTNVFDKFARLIDINLNQIQIFEAGINLIWLKVPKQNSEP
jgi:hypothetical protein